METLEYWKYLLYILKKELMNQNNWYFMWQRTPYESMGRKQSLTHWVYKAASKKQFKFTSTNLNSNAKEQHIEDN